MVGLFVGSSLGVLVNIDDGTCDGNIDGDLEELLLGLELSPIDSTVVGLLDRNDDRNTVVALVIVDLLRV